MSEYIDYDKLDDNILALNEKGWEITRGEYKRIQSVMFEMIELEIPDNATNGDSIMTMFPNCKAELLGLNDVSVIDNETGTIIMIIHKWWWNAPYKKGESE